MQLVDDRILEHLAEESWSSPTVMASKPEFEDFSERHISERCWILAHAELVAPIYDDCYVITGQGKRYLEQEYPGWFRLPRKAQAKIYSGQKPMSQS
jgi:hypothetical protein